MNIIVFKILALNAVRFLVTEKEPTPKNIEIITTSLATHFNRYQRQPKRTRKNKALAQYVDTVYHVNPLSFIPIQHIRCIDKIEADKKLFPLAEYYRKQGYTILNKTRV